MNRSERFFKLPCSVVRSLLANRRRPVVRASPLRPIVEGGKAAPLAAHRAFLARHGLIDATGNVDDTLQQALRIAAAPRERYELRISSPGSSFAVRYYSRKKYVVALHVDPDGSCEISAPIPVRQIIGRFVDTVGTPTGPTASPTIRTHAGLLQLLRGLIVAGMPVLGGALPRRRAVAVVAKTLRGRGAANAFLDSLIEDGIATETKKGLSFTPEFADWVAALAGGHRPHFVRTSLEKTTEPPLEVLFFGDKGKRQVVWPAKSGVVLCAPKKRQLRQMVGFMLGELEDQREIGKVPRVMRG